MQGQIQSSVADRVSMVSRPGRYVRLASVQGEGERKRSAAVRGVIVRENARRVLSDCHWLVRAFQSVMMHAESKPVHQSV